jgi:hypothetical protein
MQLTNQTEVILGGSSAIGLAASHFGVRCRGLMRGMTDRPARRAVFAADLLAQLWSLALTP